MYKGVELYKKGKRYAVLVSPGYGAGWSTWGDSRLAYDKRVVEFWLSHKDDKNFMETVEHFGTSYHPESDAHKEAREFFESCGYEMPYMGGFYKIKVEYVRPGELWRIQEYDGSEWLERFDTSDYEVFDEEENEPE